MYKWECARGQAKNAHLGVFLFSVHGEMHAVLFKTANMKQLCRNKIKLIFYSSSTVIIVLKSIVMIMMCEVMSCP